MYSLYSYVRARREGQTPHRKLTGAKIVHPGCAEGLISSDETAFALGVSVGGWCVVRP